MPEPIAKNPLSIFDTFPEEEHDICHAIGPGCEVAPAIDDEILQGFELPQGAGFCAKGLLIVDVIV